MSEISKNCPPNLFPTFPKFSVFPLVCKIIFFCPAENHLPAALFVLFMCYFNIEIIIFVYKWKFHDVAFAQRSRKSISSLIAIRLHLKANKWQNNISFGLIERWKFHIPINPEELLFCHLFAFK